MFDWEDTPAVVAVALVIIAAICGNAYVTHQRHETYDKCITLAAKKVEMSQALDQCKKVKP